MIRGLHSLGVIIAFMLLSAGCADDDEVRLTVLSASSLQGTLDNITTEWSADSGLNVDISYAGSQTLAAQLRGGFPADIAIFANDGLMSAVASEGLLDRTPTIFATTTLVLAFADGVNAVSLTDLAASNLVVVMADPAVPLGGYSVAVLTQVGFSTADIAPASLEASSAAVLSRLRSGDADAALIYAPDASGFNSIPVDGPTAVYALGSIAGGRTEAASLVDYLLSPAVEPHLTASGFARP